MGPTSIAKFMSKAQQHMNAEHTMRDQKGQDLGESSPTKQKEESLNPWSPTQDVSQEGQWVAGTTAKEVGSI